MEVLVEQVAPFTREQVEDAMWVGEREAFDLAWREMGKAPSEDMWNAYRRRRERRYRENPPPYPLKFGVTLDDVKESAKRGCLAMWRGAARKFFKENPHLDKRPS